MSRQVAQKRSTPRVLKDGLIPRQRRVDVIGFPSGPRHGRSHFCLDYTSPILRFFIRRMSCSSYCFHSLATSPVIISTPPLCTAYKYGFTERYEVSVPYVFRLARGLDTRLLDGGNHRNSKDEPRCPQSAKQIPKTVECQRR